MASEQKSAQDDELRRATDELRRAKDELHLLRENHLFALEELKQLRKAIENKKAEPEEEDAELALPPEPFPESPFAPNRRLLNEALLNLRRDQIANASSERKSAGTKRKAVESIACNAVKWSRVEGLYSDRMREDIEAFPCQDFQGAEIASVLEELRRQRTYLGACMDQREARRKQSITTILTGAASLLKDKNVQVRSEVPMSSAAVLSNGVADILVSRNKKRKLLVVEAKKEDFDQGKAQDLVLMEVAIAENERLGVKITPVFGIVSNFLEWYFFRYDADGIKSMFDQINETRSLEADARRIIGIVSNMIKEE